MKVSRYILRRLILREAKNILSNDHLFEGIVDDLSTAASESQDAVDKAIASIKAETGEGEFIDNTIRDVIKLDEFKDKIVEMDADAVALIFGRLRSSLTGSALSSLKKAILNVKPELKTHKFFAS